MSDAGRALLPAGLRDGLPPDAGREAEISERLMAVFARHGYERVDPPLVEFEDSFLSGAGAAMAPETFRLMDPVSQRMMAVRSDITVQVARIATTRLGAAPRPLRLGYSGQVLRVKGSQLRPQRQFRQAGIELIGASTPAADAEVVLLVLAGLAALGVADVTVDFNLPTLVPAVCAALGLPAERQPALKAALDRKDAATVAALAGPTLSAPLLALLACAGPAESALATLAAMDLPPAARVACDHAATAIAAIGHEAAALSGPGVQLTLDAVENRGFEYHTGMSFSLFARGVRGELGRGGRYDADNGDAEPATGATLFMDAVQRAARPLPPAARVLVPFGTPAAARARLHAQGHVTVAALAEGDARAEAHRLACSHVLADGDLEPVEG